MKRNLISLLLVRARCLADVVSLEASLGTLELLGLLDDGIGQAADAVRAGDGACVAVLEEDGRVAFEAFAGRRAPVNEKEVSQHRSFGQEP